jgi:ABC-type dipeptide/oligopeptide/nickel transport system permease subunit
MSTAMRAVRLAPRTALVGGVVFGLIVIVAILAPELAPQNPTGGTLSATLLPPFWMHGGSLAHILGTDELGRDELSRLIYGARVSVSVGVGAALIAGVVGVPLGVLAGYLGGTFDAVLGIVLNVFIAFPFLLLALLVAAVVGPSFSNTLLILGIAGWPVYARVIRAEVLSVREHMYVEMARTMGFSRIRVMARHIFPTVRPTFLVVASLQVGQMILAEAFLSFLGLGVQPPQPSWGNMLADGQNLIYTQWWLTVFPGMAILVTVLSVNLIADGLRRRMMPELEISDPSMWKGGRVLATP